MASLVLMLAASGCATGGDDESDGPTEPDAPLGVRMALGGTAFSVRVGATTTIPVTITRQGGYVGSVDVTVAGLPAGVRADVPRLFGATTTASITITATTTAVPSAAATYNVTGQATAITITPRPISLTITAP